jgi:hypothetical protein
MSRNKKTQQVELTSREWGKILDHFRRARERGKFFDDTDGSQVAKLTAAINLKTQKTEDAKPTTMFGFLVDDNIVRESIKATRIFQPPEKEPLF